MSSRTETPKTSFDDTTHCTDCGRRLKYVERLSKTFDGRTGRPTPSVTRWKICPKKYTGDWRLWKQVYHDSWLHTPNGVWGDKSYETPN